MTTTQIQNLIENLRQQTAENSITPTMVANILTEINSALAASMKNDQSVTIESSAAPLLYCEVVNGQLYVRNYSYYTALGLEPILFRYIKKRNRWKDNKKRKHSPFHKGWFANGKQKTISIGSGGLVYRSKNPVGCYNSGGSGYSTNASTFVENTPGHSVRGITWGSSKIVRGERMVRLSFAIGFAPKVTSETAAVKLSDLVSNLAPFFVRGQMGGDNKYIWRFSR